MTTAEQRKFKRLFWDKPVEIYPIFPSYEALMTDSSVKFFIGRLRDLSAGGIGLATQAHLLAGSTFKFHFMLNEKRWIEIFGKIVWSKEDISGVKFLSLTGLPQRSIKGYLSGLSLS